MARFVVSRGPRESEGAAGRLITDTSFPFGAVFRESASATGSAASVL